MVGPISSSGQIRNKVDKQQNKGSKSDHYKSMFLM